MTTQQFDASLLMPGEIHNRVSEYEPVFSLKNLKSEFALYAETHPRANPITTLVTTWQAFQDKDTI